mmetsp:Transcript_482/g.616  ORF Transcript_482/g.616 Transcript_482/m.616 type:complete len:299 (+) Transcript_482:114-1010(+)
MKLYGNILALCAIHSATAFTVPAPKAPTFTRLNAGAAGPPAWDASGAIPAQQQGAAPSIPGSATGSVPVRKEKKDMAYNKDKGIKVQGSTLRTCSFNENVERVQVRLTTEGRPLNANIDLWQGPDNTPQKMAVYIEDGSVRPFNAVLETPGSGNAVAIRNTAPMEFPLSAMVEANVEGGDPCAALVSTSSARTVQGGAVYTVPFEPAVASVQCALTTDGRPLKARIELLQGPNNNKKVLDVYTEDGDLRPFFIIIETPGSGNVVRIVNTATLEYPLEAHVEPYLTDTSGDGDAGMMWS